MKRLTTDNPKDNLENALNLFYIKDHETWVRGGGPGPEYADISLFDFTRLVVKEHIPDVELPADNGNLAMMMPEWLCDGSDTAEGIIALLYTAAWSYAELRHRLSAYEDFGMDPEEFGKFVYRFNQSSLGVPFDRLQEMALADKDGRLFITPCKVGDTVYWVHNGTITECRVYRIQMKRGQVYICLRSTVSHGAFRVDLCMGKTVFLSREAAEAMLAESVTNRNGFGGEEGG